jgi:hypothetical protein
MDDKTVDGGSVDGDGQLELSEATRNRMDSFERRLNFDRNIVSWDFERRKVPLWTNTPSAQDSSSSSGDYTTISMDEQREALRAQEEQFMMECGDQIFGLGYPCYLAEEEPIDLACGEEDRIRVDKDDQGEEGIDDGAVGGPYFPPLMELPPLPETDEFEIITTSKETYDEAQQQQQKKTHEEFFRYGFHGEPRQRIELDVAKAKYKKATGRIMERPQKPAVGEEGELKELVDNPSDENAKKKKKDSGRRGFDREGIIRWINDVNSLAEEETVLEPPEEV